ncbi:hypothetical protein PENTCL1PPCAC_18289, partial [Pristionchus entomophagus]
KNGDDLRTRSLLLSLQESNEGGLGDLLLLELQFTRLLCVQQSSKCEDLHLMILLSRISSNFVGDEGGDLLSVLDELDSNALANGRVRLLSLDSAANVFMGKRIRGISD